MGGFSHQDSWRKGVCSGRRGILIMMGLLAVVTLSLAVLGFIGRSYSTTLQKMKEDVKSSNRTLAVELAALEQKETSNLKTLLKVDQMVKNLTEEGKEVKSQFLDQISKLQTTLQKLNCDLEDTKHKRKGQSSGCCPRGWHLFDRSCYWLSSATNTWTEAKEDCKEKNAHLVVITKYLEKGFLSRLVKGNNVWIGLKYKNEEWRWDDGTPYTVRRIDWRPNEPNELPDDTLLCTMMYRDGLWREAPCRAPVKWVCEKLAEQ
ncbi:asialoglycoprotein receptor 1-like [Erythrolamprus reginae]|uniref:asialoglycoprotein receptor 1-like n=1 Tax=Erythrolamprus reginae TaxID=121349 RepID=UPI00396CA4E5